MSLGFLVGQGIPADRVLSTVTSVPARMLGLEGFGEIRPGAIADLALFGAEPWEPAGVVDLTMVAGKPVYTRS